MIVQILPESDLSRGFIDFMQENFKDDFCYILINGENSNADLIQENVIILENRISLALNQKARNWLSSSSAIILNWVDGAILTLLFPFRKKIAAMFWGGDLTFLLKGAESKNPIKKMVSTCIKKQVESLPCTITLSRGEYDLLRSACSLKGKWFLGSFMSNSMKEIQKKCSTRDAYDETRILLGNSATSSNRHQQMFDMLERFNKENAVFYAPLTYGDMEYRDKIIKLGKDKFGDKFVPLVKHMDSSDYLDFLSTITVGVFNHNRQQGIGNISRLLAFGAKVYLSKDGPLLEENLKDGFKVFPTEDIPNQSFEELIFMKDKDRETNTQKASFEAYSQEAKELWSKIIAYLNVVKPYERS